MLEHAKRVFLFGVCCIFGLGWGWLCGVCVLLCAGGSNIFVVLVLCIW